MFGLKQRPPSPEAPRYVPVAKIGEGGAAVVSRTFDSTLQRLVAAKELKQGPDADATARRSFTREARLVCYLDHPGVVPIYDQYATPAGRPGYVMKLVEGESLSRRLRFDPPARATPLPVAETVGLLSRVAETLAYAHDRGVAHLDVKPDNVMLGRYGEVFLVDWGNARLFDPRPYRAHLGENARDDEVRLLVEEPPDLLSGTPHFMSPEQTCRPRAELGPSSDLFSAGTLLYLALTGEVPFRAGGVNALLQAIRETDPAPVRSLNPEVPLRLQEICQRMLRKDPAERYADFHALLADLAAYRDAGQGFPVRQFEAGATVFEEGASGDRAFVVLSGRVAVTRWAPEGARRIAELGPGEIVGELAILTGEGRSATVTALEPTALRVLEKGEVERELAKLAPWVGTMVSSLARRFLGLTEELARTRRRGGT